MRQTVTEANTCTYLPTQWFQGTSFLKISIACSITVNCIHWVDRNERILMCGSKEREGFVSSVYFGRFLI